MGKGLIMKIPPIPPNCEFFYKMDDGTWFFRWRTLLSADGWSINDCLSLDMRQIIAAIAEISWRKIAEKQEYDNFRKGHGPDYESPKSEAWENVDAWRLWGEEK